MMRQSQHTLAIGVLLTALAGGSLLFAPAAMSVRAETVETTVGGDSGILDGMTFSGELGPIGKPADVKDFLVFANGTFVSKECEKRCGYPARPYFVRRVGDRTEFISETRCPGKDATIVWRGTVDNGTIRGTFTWTVDRWYWTIEKEFWFEGTLADRNAPFAGDASVPIASDR